MTRNVRCINCEKKPKHFTFSRLFSFMMQTKFMHTVQFHLKNIIVRKWMSVLNRLNCIVILFLLGKSTDIVCSLYAIQFFYECWKDHLVFWHGRRFTEGNTRELDN